MMMMMMMMKGNRPLELNFQAVHFAGKVIDGVGSFLKN